MVAVHLPYGFDKDHIFMCIYTLAYMYKYVYHVCALKFMFVIRMLSVCFCDKKRKKKL